MNDADKNRLSICMQAWRKRQAPKYEGQYDSLLPIFVTPEGKLLDIQMMVVWNPGLSDYEVGPVRQNLAGLWVPTNLPLQQQEYDKLTTVALPAYGLTKFLRLDKQGQIQSTRRQGIPDCCRPKIVSDQR